MGVSLENRQCKSAIVGLVLAALGECLPTEAASLASSERQRKSAGSRIAIALPEPERRYGSAQRCEAEPSGRGFPGFPPGSARDAVESMLGVPHNEFSGYWGDTQAVVYYLVPEAVSLGLLFDRQSQVLQQTEASFARSVGIDVVFETLDTMIGCELDDEIRAGVREVWGDADRAYRFTHGALRGLVQHESRDRLYIGVWLAELHDF